MRIYFGGTFDPVHRGHVQLALELASLFHGDAIFLMPCHKAVHKDTIEASPQQRLAMLRLALAAHPELAVDTRELMSTDPSYTFKSLSAIRAEAGQEAIAFVIGTDSLLTFPEWFQSNQLAGLTHLIVIDRPLSSFDRLHHANDLLNSPVLPEKMQCTKTEPLEQKSLERVLSLGFQEVRQPDMLRSQRAGLLLRLQLSLLDISSTEIRRRVSNKESIKNLVSDPVATYITENKLYQNQDR